MSRRPGPEKRVELPDWYVAGLQKETDQPGGQTRVGKKSHVNQTSISRVLSDKEATYDTLARLADSSVMPLPLLRVESPEHGVLCRLAAEIEKKNKEQFAALLAHVKYVAGLVGVPDDDWEPPTPQPSGAAVAAVKSVIANPLRTDRKRGVRRG